MKAAAEKVKTPLPQPIRIVTIDVDVDYSIRQDATVQMLREFIARETLKKLDDSGGVAGH